MAVLTDLTIGPTFDQAKKNENKQNLEKINWRIGELEKIDWRKDPMNELNNKFLKIWNSSLEISETIVGTVLWNNLM